MSELQIDFTTVGLECNNYFLHCGLGVVLSVRTELTGAAGAGGELVARVAVAGGAAARYPALVLALQGLGIVRIARIAATVVRIPLLPVRSWARPCNNSNTHTDGWAFPTPPGIQYPADMRNFGTCHALWNKLS